MSVERKTGEVTDAYWSRVRLEDGTVLLAYYEMLRGEFRLLHAEKLTQSQRDYIREKMMRLFGYIRRYDKAA